jgi:hypothetical protein
MGHLTLNCPRCRKWLTHVPAEGLTLHFRCDEHGLLIFQPLMLVTAEECGDCSARDAEPHSAHDAA